MTPNWRDQLSACAKRWTLAAAHEHSPAIEPGGLPLLPDAYRLDYLVRGRAEARSGRQRVRASAGDLFLSHPGESAFFVSATRDPARFLSLRFLPEPGVPCLRFPFQAVSFGPLPAEQREEFERALRRCVSERNGFHPDGALLADSLLAVCFALLLRAVRDTEPRPLREETADSCERALEFIRRHYDQPLTLTDLAAVAGLHPQYFSHKFAREKGMPPMAALTKARIEAACRLLGNTVLPVGEIGLRVGFQDAYYFSRRFKETLGLSPKAYRRQTPPEE